MSPRPLKIPAECRIDGELTSQLQGHGQIADFDDVSSEKALAYSLLKAGDVEGLDEHLNLDRIDVDGLYRQFRRCEECVRQCGAAAILATADNSLQTS